MLLRVVDLESTGLAPPESAVCEIGYVDVVARARDLIGAPTDWRVMSKVWGYFVDPGHPIPPETSAVHHIVDEDVRGAARWPEGVTLDLSVGQTVETRRGQGLIAGARARNSALVQAVDTFSMLKTSRQPYWKPTRRCPRVGWWPREEIMSKARSSLIISPLEKIGLSRTEAAAFIGATPVAFDDLVRQGDMPPARRLGKLERWDRREIEIAFAVMPHVETGKIKKLSLYSDVA